MIKPHKLNLPANMGFRNEEIRPVGAWAESPICNMIYQDAQQSAVLEEQRLHYITKAKEEKLKKFQNEVKKRVQDMARLKRLQQLEKSCKAIEAERSVVKQSAFAAEKHTSRRDTCRVRDDTELKIEHSKPPTIGGIASRYQTGNQFEDQHNKVLKHTTQARRKMVSRKVITDEFFQDDLPGSPWKIHAWRDHPVARCANQNDVIDIPEGMEDHPYSVYRKEAVNEVQTGDPPKVVRFDLDTYEDTREERIKRKSASTISGTDLERPLPQPHALYPGLRFTDQSRRTPFVDINPGILDEEERKQAKNQRALYRKLFMDIEREQVKENQRRKDHRIRISKLKKDKEDDRRKVEQISREFTAVRDPMTGETEAEKTWRHALEDELTQDTKSRQQIQLQKAKETERYVEALKANLKRKAERLNITLPALCCCAETFWDTHPDTCANNCEFYRNPKAYAKCLQSLLMSCDVV